MNGQRILLVIIGLEKDRIRMLKDLLRTWSTVSQFLELCSADIDEVPVRVQDQSLYYHCYCWTM
jgi:hypothetical protein